MIEDETVGLGGKLDFLTHFADLPDPRQALKVLYPLDEVLLLTLCAVICGADGWVAVSLFGKAKLAFLRRFLPFKNGVPSHDQLGLIFGALDAAAFQSCFIAWAQSLSKGIAGVVAVDGKTLRRSFDKAGGKGAIHMVSAWSSAQKLVLGARCSTKRRCADAGSLFLSLQLCPRNSVPVIHVPVIPVIPVIARVSFRAGVC